jgi:hypothetical protein
MVRERPPGHPAQGQEARGVTELGRGLGQRSRPGDDGADKRQNAKAANDVPEVEGDADMFTRAGVAAE